MCVLDAGTVSLISSVCRLPVFCARRHRLRHGRPHLWCAQPPSSLCPSLDTGTVPLISSVCRLPVFGARRLSVTAVLIFGARRHLLLQRNDMITKHQFALHLMRDSTVIPNHLPTLVRAATNLSVRDTGTAFLINKCLVRAAASLSTTVALIVGAHRGHLQTKTASALAAASFLTTAERLVLLS